MRPFDDLKRLVRSPDPNQLSYIVPVGLFVWLGILAIVALFWGVYYFVRGVYSAACWLVASRLTPKGHRLFGAYGESKAARELVSQGYGITPDWASDAVTRIPKS